MKSDIFAIIRINTAQGNNRTSQVSADVFDNSLGVAEIRFGIDIETAFCNQAMDVRIPLKRTTEGVENTNKSGNKVFYPY